MFSLLPAYWKSQLTLVFKGIKNKKFCGLEEKTGDQERNSSNLSNIYISL